MPRPSPSSPSLRPLAGLNVQKTSLLLYPEHLCGDIERYNPETYTFSYERLTLPRTELHTATLHGIARTTRIKVAYSALLIALLSPLLAWILPLWSALLCSIFGFGLFLLLRLLIPIRLLHLRTATETYHIPIQWWERADTRAFLSALNAN